MAHVSNTPLRLSSADFSTSTRQKVNAENQDIQKLLQTNGVSESYSNASERNALIDAEVAFDRLETFETNNKVLKQKYDTIGSHLEQLSTAATLFQTEIMQSRSDSSGKLVDVQAIATEFLSKVDSILNQRDSGGESYYAGGASKYNAVSKLADLEALGGNATAAENDYYIGGTKGTLILVNDDQEVDKFPITAENSAFEKVIRAARIFKGADPANPSDPLKAAAEKLADEAIKEIGQLKSAIATDGRTIREANKMIAETKLSVTETINDLGVNDTMELFTQWQQNQAQLLVSEAMILQDFKSVQDFLQQLRNI